MHNAETYSPAPTVTKSALIAAVEFLTDPENWQGRDVGLISPATLAQAIGTPHLFTVVDLLKSDFTLPKQIGGLRVLWNADTYQLSVCRIH